ncbi:MAG: DeoR/GlpR transcriptional regulator [Clostridia bacterium]|nr:DeoR/GlpR transcriptional regulator [Clostridia bacterium]
MNYRRREKVREIILSKPFTTLKELEEMFPDVSSMTLRRDIEYCENRGDAMKVRGGAKSMKFITTSMEDPIYNRMNSNVSVKKRIAKKAAEYFEQGRSIFVDSGTTCIELAQLMSDMRITVTTTGPNVALNMIKNTKPMINLVGGLINRENMSISGAQALDYINSINIDLAFISPSGFSLENGFTSGNFNECELKKTVVSKAREVIMLLDATKLEKDLPYTFCQLNDIHMIITNTALPPAYMAAAEKNNVKIVIAN